MEERKDKSNKKRVGFVGFAFIAIMAWLIAGSVSFTAYAGCEGDCMRCHPTLKDSAEHKSLETCVLCHNGTNKGNKLFNQMNADSGCGTRCFLCHNEWPKDSHHSQLNTCLTCHDK